jgi:hypothetical protein
LYGAKEGIPWLFGAKEGTKGDNTKSYLELGLWSDSAEYDCDLTMHAMIIAYGSKIPFTKSAYTQSVWWVRVHYSQTYTTIARSFPATTKLLWPPGIGLKASHKLAQLEIDANLQMYGP